MDSKSEDTQSTQPNSDGYPVAATRLDPIARVLLLAVYDDNHAFSKLRGLSPLVQIIWQFTLQFNAHYWPRYISDDTAVLRLQHIQFPKPQDLNINMMPFIMSMDFDETKLPQSLQPSHQQLITQCLPYDRTQHGKIGFLSIQESFVGKGKTQRRPGLHIEAPGYVEDGQYTKGQGRTPGLYWGSGGVQNEKMNDGIYLASTVASSCVAWNCNVDEFASWSDDEEEEEEEEEEADEMSLSHPVGRLGEIEHFRTCLDENHAEEIMSANRLYWITDRTPHESLPMEKDGYRQFFRLVTHKVSVWYGQHSTKNPNGVTLDKEMTRIIQGSKFSSK